MRVSGQGSITYPPSRVWHALVDPEVMKDCIPGCESFVAEDEQHYTATIAANLLLVKMTFDIRLVILDAKADQYYRFEASGDGGMSGNASCQCEMFLSPSTTDVRNTDLGYEAHVEMHGMLKRVAEPLLKQRAEQLINKFLRRFEKAIQKTD